jgi:hypothetical protein
MNEENAVARFDPNTYPDRFTFEAHARRLRAEEIATIVGAVADWVHDRQREFARRLGRLIAALAASSHRHTTR